ncbi:MAG: glutamate-5-semialdehyde dehydrogenase [Oscillospiraceae bacterium]|nr:glutamate-5-semialdehyde dehydrogenase [Oscillospiraceae bacterium]
MTEMQLLADRARKASREIANLPEEKKNEALHAISADLRASKDVILKANDEDIAAAEKAGISPAMADRLRLTSDRIESMADGVDQVAALPDPTGKLLSRTVRPNGLVIEKVSVPLGVVGIIYEARPNVTADAGALCFKSGNAVLLRGGKEAVRSSGAIARVMRHALEEQNLPADCICFVEDTSRESAKEMMGLVGRLDVLIPRGGAGLIKSVVENSKVPVIETGVGICHVYVEKTADLEMAANIIKNAKCSRPSVCNAAECLLVDEEIAGKFLPMAAEAMAEYSVKLLGDEKACAVLPNAVPAAPEDFDTEFLDYILAIKVVSGPDEAIAFIAEHGTGHSEAVVTRDESVAERFLREVDAAAVYVNASTRFTDGGEFGLGAELGISTQKLHARGPMGLAELTSSKYRIRGTGQIR